MSRRKDTSSSSHDESVITDATTMSPSSPKPAADYSGLPQYYSGLPGNPKLLARSNDDPVPVQRDETFPLYKQLSNVGSHKIVQIFDSGPREDIRKILHNHEIPWLTVNVIRIGYSATAAQNPVVLLVTVKEGTNPLQAQDAASDCRDCLTGYINFQMLCSFCSSLTLKIVIKFTTSMLSLWKCKSSNPIPNTSLMISTFQISLTNRCLRLGQVWARGLTANTKQVDRWVSIYKSSLEALNIQVGNNVV